MTQTIEYVVKVDANQAKTTIADVEKRMESAAKPASVFGLSIANIGQQTKDMAGKLGPAAAAISSVSASLGAAGGEAGKLVAAGGQIVAAFGAGGPVGAAIVAATVAVDAMSVSWKKATEEQDAALERMFKNVNAQLAVTRTTKVALDEARASLTAALRVGEDESVTFQRSLEEARKAGAKRVEEAQARLDKLKATSLDLRQIEKDAESLDMTFQQARLWRSQLREKEIASAERALANTQSQAMIATQTLVTERKRTEQAERKAAAEQRFKSALEGQMRSYEAMYRFREVEETKIEDIETNTDEISRTMRGLRAVEGGGLGSAIIERAAAERKAAIDALSDEDILTGGGQESMVFDIITEDGVSRQIEVQKNGLDIIAQLNDEYRQQEIAAQSEFVMQWTSIGVDALQTYLDAKIKGEENAEALMAASLMRTAGQALVGHGINLAGAAVVSASTGLLPVAAAQAGAAAGLIAGGVALGATATGIEHVSAGGTVGKPIEDKQSTRDPGASPRSGGSGGGGGPMIVNVTYGAGGPLPEDIAREIHKVTASGNRRRGAA